MPQSTKKCIVKGCTNHKGQGYFIGDLCGPCYNMLTDGHVGPSNAWFAVRIIDLSNTIQKARQMLGCDN